ncbi:MAG: dNTP triphosphohydrolase [bacterium]|nr:dNTP triphosphohydrolase [bacterium]
MAKKTKQDPPTKRHEPLSSLGGRTEYERDYTAILYSHAFRRLRFKTQVFYFPVNDHISTRLDHSLYVSSISAIICRNLKDKGIECDPILASAIGLGHDLGHPPFGHAGETALNELASNIGGFTHANHSLRIVDKIEKPRQKKPIIGLNLTLATRDGIVNHCGESSITKLKPASIKKYEEVGTRQSLPCTIEGCVVRLVDKVAYLGRDIEDALMEGIIEKTQLPSKLRRTVGEKNGEIVEYFVTDIIANSDHTQICLSDEAAAHMKQLGDLSIEAIYENDFVKEMLGRIKDMLNICFDIILKAIDENRDNISGYMNYDDYDARSVLGNYIEQREILYFEEEKYADDGARHRRIAVDFLSTLTDRFVFEMFEDYFLVRPF